MKFDRGLFLPRRRYRGQDAPTEARGRCARSRVCESISVIRDLIVVARSRTRLVQPVEPEPARSPDRRSAGAQAPRRPPNKLSTRQARRPPPLAPNRAPRERVTQATTLHALPYSIRLTAPRTPS